MNANRRTFLGICLSAMSTIIAAASLYPLFRYLAPRAAGPSAGKVTISLRDLPQGGAQFFEFGGSSAVAVHKRDGQLVVLSAVCTHLGCIVQWQKEHQDFLCPCHAGHYAADGTVTGGPPPKPLAKLPFTVADGMITVG